MQVPWLEREPKTVLLEGRLGQNDYSIRYPQIDGGRPAFDRFWQQQAFFLRLQCGREQGHYPVELSADWQETRRDEMAASGFLEIRKRIGRADWRLSRISAVFLPGGYHPATMESLFLPGKCRQLPAAAGKKLQILSAEGETPFFRDAPQKGRRLFLQQQFYLTGEGLAVWYPPELLAPRIAGLPTVFFPFEELSGMLRFLL